MNGETGAGTIPGAIGKYSIEADLGEGAMGRVYRGYDPVLGRRVAIKRLHQRLRSNEVHGELAQRFRREARAAAALSPPHIVAVYDFIEELGVASIVMEYVEGPDLKAIIQQHGRSEPAWVFARIAEVLDGLAYCHESGIIHRDIKPANIMLSKGRAKIADFGIAHTPNSDLTQVGDQIGSPPYMSPEQFVGGPVDNRSDLFAVGVVLYELLTGSKPFIGQTAHEYRYPDTSQLRPPLPRGADRVMRKALAKRPQDRFQSARDFAAAVRALPDAPPLCERRRLCLGGAILLASGLAVGGWWWWDRPAPGTVSVASRPAGVAVWLADRQLGVARFRLPAGRHPIVLRRDGYEDLPVSLEVEPGAAIDTELTLPRSGRQP